MLKRYSLTPSQGACFYCEKPAAYLSTYTYRVVGKRHNVTVRREVCEEHGERFARRFGVPLERGAAS